MQSPEVVPPTRGNKSLKRRRGPGKEGKMKLSGNLKKKKGVGKVRGKGRKFMDGGDHSVACW